MQLSENFSLNEFTKSDTAVRKGIDNTPNDDHLKSMKALCENVLQKVRSHFGKSVRITSGYRSPKLNEAIGGVATSSHCKGNAIDLDDVYGHASNADMYHWIKKNLSFDQLIWEFGTDMNPNWIHVSYVSEEDNRNRCLKAYKDEGKTKYKVI